MSKLSIASTQAEITDRFNRLTDLVETSQENANRHGERFNIFSILGVQRDENRTHSRYLSELLNPAGRHGESSRFLKAFVEDVLGHSLDIIGRVKVTRELATEERRRVDIVVESPDVIIGIEVKIDAGDQKEQLHDYFKELNQRARGQKRAVLVYLTLDGKPPSGRTLGGLEQGSVRCLSFAEDIRQWIGNCAGLCEHKPELSYALIQYKRLLETLTGAGTSMTSLIADKLVCNRNDMETALAVEKALPEAKAAIMLRFWDELSSAMADAFGATPEPYGAKTLRELSHNYFNGRGGKHVGIKHTIGERNGNKICLYVNVYHAVHYGLRIECSSGSLISDSVVKNRLRKTLNNGNAVADKEADWLVCYYYDPSPSHEPAILNFHSFEGPVLDLLDDENRRVVINNMVEHQIRLVREAKILLEATPNEK